MSQWKKVKIGDFLKRKRVPVVLDERTKYKLVTVRLYHKGIILREEKLGSLIKSNMYKVSKGDFILSGIDARNGAFGIIPEELDGAIVTNDFWYFDIDESIIKREYFLWLTSTPVFLNACQKASKGETQRIRLQKEAFFDYEINCPTVEYQDDFLSKIIPVINKIEEVKKQTDQQLEYTKLLRQNILQDAIEGKLTADWRKSHPVINGNPDYDAEALFEKIQKEKASDNKQKQLSPITDEEKPFEIPEGWKWVRLGELCNFGICQNIEPDSLKPDDWILDLEDIEKDTGRIISIRTFSENNSQSTKHVFYKGFVLYSKLRPYLNKVVIVPKNGYCTSEILPLDFGVYNNSRYMQITLMSPYFVNYTTRLSYGMKMPRLGTNDGKIACIPLPPLKEQEEIVNKVESLLAKVTELENQIQERRTLSEKLAFGIIKEKLEG